VIFCSMQYFEKIVRLPAGGIAQGGVMGGNAPSPVKEIDEILRAVCSVDEKKRGVCASCPYRDYFYGGEEVVGKSISSSALTAL